MPPHRPRAPPPPSSLPGRRQPRGLLRPAAARFSLPNIARPRRATHFLWSSTGIFNPRASRLPPSAARRGAPSPCSPPPCGAQAEGSGTISPRAARPSPRSSHWMPPPPCAADPLGTRPPSDWCTEVGDRLLGEAGCWFWSHERAPATRRQRFRVTQADERSSVNTGGRG
ncbi:hypothetical protein BS78_08G108000 [Paspalum vaginatum]|nr:hypothetical protein BS78_08G108000 [Paspalum vaginatum]